LTEEQERGTHDLDSEEGKNAEAAGLATEESTKILVVADQTNTEARGAARPQLVLLTGPRVGETFVLDGAVKLGRSSEMDIQLDADGISRHHCTFLCLPSGEVMIRDNGSTNGTFVNGDRITEQTLSEGDKITVSSLVVVKFTHHDRLDRDFQKAMYDAALRDGLTGAFNKRYFADRLENEFSFHLRHKTPLSLLMLDLDHFKRLNDTSGHLAGDQVLKTLVEQVSATIRTEDVLCRYGGEEFAVICREIPIPSAHAMAERIRRSVAFHRFEWEGKRLVVTCSIGVAGVPFAGIEGALELVEAADRALYRSKAEGRNRVSVNMKT
jgi:diguanylate cyclase (GGDEF)-like protein